MPCTTKVTWASKPGGKFSFSFYKLWLESRLIIFARKSFMLCKEWQSNIASNEEDRLAYMSGGK